MNAKRTLAEGDYFDVVIPMRWADADMQQHMNNAVYFRFMEEGRILMLAAADASSTAQEGVVVAHCACDFLREITYPATLRVRHIVDRLGRSSLTHRVEMCVLDDLESGPYAVGRSVMVRVNRATAKSAPWPEEILAKLAAISQPGATAVQDR